MKVSVTRSDSTGQTSKTVADLAEDSDIGNLLVTGEASSVQAILFGGRTITFELAPVTKKWKVAIVSTVEVEAVDLDAAKEEGLLQAVQMNGIVASVSEA